MFSLTNVGRLGSLGRATRGGGAAFSPLALFAAGEEGAWYDPSDLSTLFQDAAGTTPVTAANDPVRLILDKSGNANHATAPSDAARPLLKQTAGGLWYLQFDGVDDYLATASAFSLSQRWHRSSAILVPSIGGRVFFGDTAFGGQLYKPAATTAIATYNGNVLSLSGGTSPTSANVVTEVANGANSKIITDLDAVTGNSGTNAGSIQHIACRNTGTPDSFLAIRLYGVVTVGRALSDAEQSNVRTYLAGLCGVTLP